MKGHFKAHKKGCIKGHFTAHGKGSAKCVGYSLRMACRLELQGGHVYVVVSLCLPCIITDNATAIAKEEPL